MDSVAAAYMRDIEREVKIGIAAIGSDNTAVVQSVDRLLGSWTMILVREGGCTSDFMQAVGDAIGELSTAQSQWWRPRWSALADLVRDAARASSRLRQLQALDRPGSKELLIQCAMNPLKVSCRSGGDPQDGDLVMGTALASVGLVDIVWNPSRTVATMIPTVAGFATLDSLT